MFDPETGEFIYAFDKMMAKLDDLAVIRPEMALLKRKLTSDNYPAEKKAQFFKCVLSKL